MDTWKKTYSNAADYSVAMDTFWSTFDAEGWSIFRGGLFAISHLKYFR
jgi:hypothetical protein